MGTIPKHRCPTPTKINAPKYREENGSHLADTQIRFSRSKTQVLSGGFRLFSLLRSCSLEGWASQLP